MTSTNVNREAVYGTLPVMKGERTYGFWDFFLVLTGYGIATWCFTQGAYIASLTGFKETVVSIVAANLLFITVIALAIPPVVRYGIDLWVSMRSLYGYRGVRVIAVLLVIVNFPWYAVAAGIFGSSMVRLANAFGIELPESTKPILALICVLVGTLIALGGPVAIKWSNRITVPMLILVAIAIVVIALGAVPFSDIVNFQPDSGMGARESYALSIEGNIAFAMSWVAAIGVMPRLARRESHGVAGTVLSYGVVVPLILLVGAIMAISMSLTFGYMTDDMTEMLILMSSPVVGLLAVFGVGVANITTQGIGSYSYSIALKSAFPKIDYRIFVWILAAYTGAITLWDGIMDHFGAFLSLAGLIYAPFIGLMIADFYFVRRSQFSLRSIFRIDGHSAYKYTGGFNLVAFVAMAAGALIAFFTFNPLTGEIGNPIFYVMGSSAFAVVSTMVIYVLLALIPSVKRYLLQDRDELTP